MCKWAEGWGGVFLLVSEHGCFGIAGCPACELEIAHLMGEDSSRQFEDFLEALGAGSLEEVVVGGETFTRTPEDNYRYIWKNVSNARKKFGIVKTTNTLRGEEHFAFCKP